MSAWQPEQLVRRVARQQAGDGAVAEVEHEARALVAVVEQVRLAAGGDEQHVPQLGLGEQEVAGEPQRDRRAAGDVGVLEGVRVHAPEPVRDPGRRLPDGIVLPQRAVVEDDVDLGRVDVVLAEQPRRRLDRHVADVLARRGDVLAAQAELLQDHLLRDPARRSRSPLRVIHCSGRYAAVAAIPITGRCLSRRSRAR